jgi:hypothetical protein
MAHFVLMTLFVDILYIHLLCLMGEHFLQMHLHVYAFVLLLHVRNMQI